MSKLPKIANPSRRAYPSDLSDSEWSTIAPLLPGNKGFGHPRTVDLREIINAIFYLQRSGCQWASCPMTFPLMPRFMLTSANGNDGYLG
jgi:putative transposase